MRIESIPAIPRPELEPSRKKDDQIRETLIFAINQELRKSPGVDWLSCYRTRLTVLFSGLKSNNPKFEEAQQIIDQLNKKIDEISEEGSLDKRRPEPVNDYLDLHKFINS